MKAKTIEKNLPLGDLELFLEDEDDFYISKTEVQCFKENCFRDIKDLNYILLKKLKVKIHRIEHEIFNKNTNEYEFEGSSFIITDKDGDTVLYEGNSELVTDVIMDYLNMLGDDDDLYDLDEVKCDIILIS